MTIDYPGSSPRQINQTSNSWSMSIHPSIRSAVLSILNFAINHFIHSLTHSLTLPFPLPPLSTFPLRSSPPFAYCILPLFFSFLYPPLLLSSALSVLPSYRPSVGVGLTEPRLYSAVPLPLLRSPSNFIKDSAAPAAT